MKKIILATTLLAASSSVAMAESHMTWAATAAAGIAADGDVTAGGLMIKGGDPLVPYVSGNFYAYSNVNLAVTLSGATDGGLTFGATFDTTAGTGYSLADDDGFGDNGGAFGMPTIFVSGSFGKIELSDDSFDFYDDTNGSGDARYSGTFGAVTVGLVADVDTNNASLSVGYTAGALALSANADTYDLSNISATYTMGTIAVTAATDESSNASLKVAYSNNGISASAKYNTDGGATTPAPSIDIAAGYSANGLSVNADTNTESNHWTVTVGYDLGGGLALEAGTNYTSDIMVGATMAF